MMMKVHAPVTEYYHIPFHKYLLLSVAAYGINKTHMVRRIELKASLCLDSRHIYKDMLDVGRINKSHL